MSVTWLSVWITVVFRIIVGGDINNWITADICFTWQTTYHFTLKQSWRTSPGHQKISHIQMSTPSIARNLQSVLTSFFLETVSNHVGLSTAMKRSNGYNGYLFTQQNTAHFVSKLCICLRNSGLAVDNNGQHATMQFYMGWVYMREYLQFTSCIIHNAKICILHRGIALSKNNGGKN